MAQGRRSGRRHRPGRGLHFDTSLIAFEVAAKGGGVGLGRSSMTGEDLASGRLVAPFDLAVPNTEAFYLITPSEDAAHPDATLFRDWLLEESDLAFGPHLRP